jgi:hypothetical protein
MHGPRSIEFCFELAYDWLSDVHVRVVVVVGWSHENENSKNVRDGAGAH